MQPLFAENPWVPFVLLALWAVLAAIVSMAAGWWNLAQAFPGSKRAGEPISQWRHQTLLLRSKVPYRGGISVVAYPRGVHFRIRPLYRLFHAPFFLPWGAIEYMEIERTPIYTLVMGVGGMEIRLQGQAASGLPRLYEERTGRRVTSWNEEEPEL